MLQLNGIKLIRFEEEVHTAQVYAWYYSFYYKEFFNDRPQCPRAIEIAKACIGNTFMILRESDSLIIGMAQIANDNDVSRNFELGILIDKQHQKQGHFVTTLKILLNWKFNFCNFFKAKLKVLGTNKKALGIITKFSFVKEGVLKKETFLNGKFHDMVDYTMFKTDFNKLYSKDFENTEPRLEPLMSEDNKDGVH